MLLGDVNVLMSVFLALCNSFRRSEKTPEAAEGRIRSLRELLATMDRENSFTQRSEGGNHQTGSDRGEPAPLLELIRGAARVVAGA